MNKKEIISFLKKNIMLLALKVFLHPFDGEGNIKRSINIIILKGFLIFVKKEKDFMLNIKSNSFTESLLETIDTISTENAYRVIERTRNEESFGLHILSEEIEKSRNTDEGDQE